MAPTYACTNTVQCNTGCSGTCSVVVRRIPPAEPALHADRMRAGHHIKAAILFGAVVQRPPETYTRLRLRVQEGAVLVRAHIPPYNLHFITHNVLQRLKYVIVYVLFTIL